MPSASSAEEDDAGSLLPTTDELSQALAGSDSPDSPPRPLERSANQLPSPPLLPTPPPKASCKATKPVTGGSAYPSSPRFSRLPSSLSMASAHLAWLQIQADSHLCLCLGSAGCRESSYEAMVVECRLLGLSSAHGRVLCQSEENLLDSQSRACGQPSGRNLPRHAHTCLHCLFCSLRVPHSLLHTSLCVHLGRAQGGPGSSCDSPPVICSCVISLCSSGLTGGEGGLTTGSQHLLIWVGRLVTEWWLSSLLRTHF